MAVVKVERRAGARLLQINGTGTTVNGRAVEKPTGQLVYDVYSDDPTDNEFVMQSSPLLPWVNNVLVMDGQVIGGVYVTGYTPTYIGPAGNLWKWEFCYTLGGEFSANDKQTTAEAEETQVKELGSFSVSVELSDVASKFDVTGRRNVNTLGEWFAEPITLSRATVNFNYTFQTTANPLKIIELYNNTVNSAPLWGLAPGTVLARISGSAQLLSDGNKWSVNYVMSYRPDGWAERRANAGNYYVYGNSVVRATNDDGSPKEEPVLLDANGALLAANADPVFIGFQVYNAQDLNALDLPNPFNL